MPTQLVYIIDKYKFEAWLVFYLLIAAILLPLTSLAKTAGGAPSQVSAAILPYSEPRLRSTAQQPVEAALATPLWPLHGGVTTNFGASDYPYQSTHTGIDISSAHRSGSMPIVAFQSGTVIGIIRSSSGLGNHVIIDHGNGMTSVYAHLYSIQAFQGQQVRAGDAIGTEGSTGASTGTHLHFEIRINDKPVNPRRYIQGAP